MFDNVEATNIHSLVPILGVLVSLFVVRLMVNNREKHARCSLPPGPRPFPVVGNVMSVNSKEPWVTYTDWGKTYGPLVYSRLFNKDVIVINSERIAKDILDRRSSVFSDRPTLITMDLFGWSWNVTFMPYGERWRQCRRLFHQTFRPEAALTYRPVQMCKVHQLLMNLLETPHEYGSHLQTMSSSIIMAIAYGYDTAPRHDAFVKVVEDALNLALGVITPERAALLGAFPFLIRLPYWFPGAGFQKKAQESRHVSKEQVDAPFRHVTQNLASNSLPPCICSDLLGRMKDGGNIQRHEGLVKDVAATAFSAASDTTSSAMLIFTLAMLQNPKVQAKAQAEIDAIVGRDRLPEFSDRASLPYIDAVPLSPSTIILTLQTGVAHAATADDIYEGYYIPKGATVMANLWAMSHDESIYPDPYEFKPERFLSNGKLIDDVVSYAFGFGRRVCIGRHVADASLWAGITSILSVFNIKKALDDSGKEVEFEVQWTSGLTT
ncbi:hypothetical protein SERLADRAFT_440764 [Serpula lacrymans var. lacrymans S7.9]|nr:uncharacterized protein SERLADRAFT_440764 [Serpula lacrymans var. lacrymans S7.9]EGO21511.1 hypothetical protein SERLADRAFT_440764 [Serpula lacrymans var. lacrymans S7.9]